MEINKILVPIDFSTCAINALSIAAKIAKKQNIKLEIVHAIHLPSELQIDVLAGPMITEPALSKQEAEIDVEFEALKNTIPELNDIEYKTVKSIASTTDLINTCLSSEMSDLIIMGTKSKHDLVDKLIGSVSADIIKTSKIPVLVIPENFKSFNISRIGFAADLKRIEDIKKLDILIWFGKITGAEIKAFHISQKDDFKHPTEHAQERMKVMDVLTSSNHSYVWIDESEIVNGIFDFVDSHKLDMLVMFPRHHNFWDKIWHPSITQKVVMEVQIPLLTIHE